MNDFLLITLFFCSLGFSLGRSKLLYAIKNRNSRPNSLPSYYGITLSFWLFFANLIFLPILIFNIFEIEGILLTDLVFIDSLIIIFGLFILKPSFKARHHVEFIYKIILILISSIAILVTLSIFLSIFAESVKFFQLVPFSNFFFGLEWNPQASINENGEISHGNYGIIPLLTGTFLITIIALSIAVPFGIFSAIYLSEYASRHIRNITKPILEILAGVPTVVYGYFAAVNLGPFIRYVGEYFSLNVTSESALAAGIAMGIMIIPFVLSLSDDIINAVPQNLRDASLALGATKSETILKVVFPSALPGIISSIIMALSRSIGETMIVAMAAGITAKLTFNPLSSVSTVTVQIMTMLVGDEEFNSPKTLSAFALGLTLFLITLLLNYIAIMVVKKYREKYE